MKPNVFWTFKDWTEKEPWDAHEKQQLLDKAKGLDVIFHDIQPPHDVNVLLLGPRDMRADAETSELLCVFAQIDTDHFDIPVDVHWDGQQFWLRPDESQRENIVSYLSETKMSIKAVDDKFYRTLLPMMGKWIAEEDWYEWYGSY